ncbi:hypothetical protein ACJZ2D_003061 [Fusarium nematophilum]
MAPLTVSSLRTLHGRTPHFQLLEELSSLEASSDEAEPLPNRLFSLPALATTVTPLLPRHLLLPLKLPPRLATLAEPVPALDIVPPPRLQILPAHVPLVRPPAALAARPPLDHALEVVAVRPPARPARARDGEVDGAAGALGAVGHGAARLAVDVAPLVLVAAGVAFPLAGAHLYTVCCACMFGS